MLCPSQRLPALPAPSLPGPELHPDTLQDDARTVPTEVREINRRRRDKLVERRAFPQRETSMESFFQGACGGLRNITVVKGEQRKMDFFPAARLDGLVQVSGPASGVRC